jgi:hypothetical protein
VPTDPATNGGRIGLIHDLSGLGLGMKPAADDRASVVGRVIERRVAFHLVGCGRRTEGCFLRIGIEPARKLLQDALLDELFKMTVDGG